MTAPSMISQDHVAARSRLVKTVIYYAGFVALGLTAASLGPTLTGLAENTRSTLGQVSILFTARSLGYLLGSVLAGRVYDRLPGHRLMAIGLVALGITLASAPIVPVLWALTGLLLVMGLAEGLFDVGGNTLLVWVHGEAVGPFMNALHFFFGLGAFIAPIIIGQVVLVTGGIKLAYWILAVLAITPAIALLAQPSPASPHSDSVSMKGPVQTSLVAMLMVFFFLYVGAEVSFGGWIYTYAEAQNLAVGAQAAYLTSAFWGSFTVGRLFSIPIARRFRPRVVLLVDLIGCIVSVSVMLAWPTSAWIGWVGAIGTGLFMASIFPTAILLAERRMALTGYITSLFFLGASTGAMLVPFLIGQFFERLGPPVTLGFILTALVLDLIVFFLLALRFPASQHE
jgi:MFS transporter, FHS family, Na+ dependent glucose transporter 1